MQSRPAPRLQDGFSVNQKKPLVVSAWAPLAQVWASGWLCVDWKVQPRDLSVDWGFQSPLPLCKPVLAPGAAGGSVLRPSPRHSVRGLWSACPGALGPGTVLTQLPSPAPRPFFPGPPRLPSLPLSSPPLPSFLPSFLPSSSGEFRFAGAALTSACSVR